VSSGGRRDSFQNLLLKGYVFGIVFLEPRFRGGEDLDVLGIANPLAGLAGALHGCTGSDVTSDLIRSASARMTGL
jgi:hypothetical protein